MKKYSALFKILGLLIFCWSFYYIFLHGGLTGLTLWENFMLFVNSSFWHLFDLFIIFQSNNPLTVNTFSCCLGIFILLIFSFVSYMAS